MEEPGFNWHQRILPFILHFLICHSSSGVFENWTHLLRSYLMKMSIHKRKEVHGLKKSYQFDDNRVSFITFLNQCLRNSRRECLP